LGDNSGWWLDPGFSLKGGGKNQIKLIFDTVVFNPLAPSDPYMGRTAQLTFRRCILNTYSTNIHTKFFFKCCTHSVLFSSKYRLFHNSTLFAFYIIHILNTECAKI
jgi:hypothetical protein